MYINSTNYNITSGSYGKERHILGGSTSNEAFVIKDNASEEQFKIDGEGLISLRNKITVVADPAS
eukprot:Pgem_evm1s16242